MISDVNQLDRLVGGIVGNWSYFDFFRVDQWTRDATTRSVRPRSAVPGEHGPEDVVRPHATDHIGHKRVSGDQAHIMRHLNRDVSYYSNLQ